MMIVLNNYEWKRLLLFLAHITGEGLEGNIPRILPAGRRVALRKDAWPRPAVFDWLQRIGNIDEPEMFRVFNMGIGFVMIVSRYYANSMLKQLDHAGYPAWIIGE